MTLLDVAQDAGVSRATASLVLRGSPLVADDTRAKVLASMDKLRYVYNRAAASLRTRCSQTIGLVVNDITNPFFAQMTVGSEAHLDEANCAVLLSNTSEKLDKQDRLLETMYEYGVDGVLMCPALGTPPDTVDRMRRWRLPFVLVARYLFDVEVDYVGADNVLGAEIAVEHLLAQGHHCIAFVGGTADSSARRDRLRGYTDVVAFGVMLGLRTAGRVPGKNFAVVGFDDIDEAALWRPALTMVSIAPRQIGVEAARLLLECITDPDGEPRQVILPPELIVRESCGDYIESRTRDRR